MVSDFLFPQSGKARKISYFCRLCACVLYVRYKTLSNMITFGYKNRFTGPLRALTALAIGIVMVVSKANALNIAVQIIAAFLLASGLVSLIVGMINKQNGTLPLMAVNTVVDILIGLVLFMFPGFFANVLVFFIALALLGFALFQLVALVSANRVTNVGLGAFALPVLVLIGGVFLLFRPSFLGSALGTVAGVMLIIYGVSELLSSWKMRKAIDEYDIKYPAKPAKEEPEVEMPEQDIKDVDYEKADEQ